MKILTPFFKAGFVKSAGLSDQLTYWADDIAIYGPQLAKKLKRGPKLIGPKAQADIKPPPGNPSNR